MKSLCSLGCLNTRSDLEYSSSAFNRNARSKNAKGTKLRSLTMVRLCPCCSLDTCLEHSRSNVVFEITTNFIFGMLCFSKFGPKCNKDNKPTKLLSRLLLEGHRKLLNVFFFHTGFFQVKSIRKINALMFPCKIELTCEFSTLK